MFTLPWFTRLVRQNPFICFPHEEDKPWGPLFKNKGFLLWKYILTFPAPAYLSQLQKSLRNGAVYTCNYILSKCCYFAIFVLLYVYTLWLFMTWHQENYNNYPYHFGIFFPSCPNIVFYSCGGFLGFF